jgi:hypothetical protein
MAVRSHAAAALAVLVCAALIVACGSGDETKSGAARSHQRTLHLTLPPPGVVGVDGDFTPIFHGRKPFMSGDSFVRWDRFPSGGFQMSYCVIARQHPLSTFWCTDTYVLPKGQIISAGDVDRDPSTHVLPVVGGTGAYAGARGSVRAVVGRRGGSTTITLR